MSDFESDLARTPLRRAPAEWRGEILRTARAAAAEGAAPLGWRSWLAPHPLTLAAAWLVIAVLRLATPGEPASTPTADFAQIRAQMRAQQKLLAELLNPAVPAPPPAREQGASAPRRNHQPA